MSTSSAPRADTFGATSGATTSGTSDPGYEVLSSTNGPNSFSFNGLTGGPGLLSLVLGHYKGAPRRVCGAHGEQNSQSHVFRQLVSSALWVTLFQIFLGLNGVREVVYFGGFRW